MKSFVEKRAWMPRRNYAALFLAATIGSAGPTVSPPATSLTLTVNAPAIFNGNINLPQTASSAVFIERITYQPNRRGAKQYLAASQSAPLGPSISIPSVNLQFAVNPPLILQATPILHGQDLQYNKTYTEEWYPPRRNYAFLLNQGPTLNVNVIPLALQLPAPAVTVTGTVSPPALSFSLGIFAPTITQANSGLVSVPLVQLSLSMVAPDISITGSLLVAPMVLTLTFPDPTITQGEQEGQAKLPNVPYISGIGPWDITVRTYG